MKIQEHIPRIMRSEMLLTKTIRFDANKKQQNISLKDGGLQAQFTYSNYCSVYLNEALENNALIRINFYFDFGYIALRIGTRTEAD